MLSKNIRPNTMQRLHENISNAERIDLIRDYPLAEIYSAPGHKQLRCPGNIVEIKKHINSGKTLLDKLPIVLNIYTHVDDGKVHISNIECIDGNHRLAAFLYMDYDCVDRIGTCVH